MVPLHSMLRGEGGGPLKGDHWTTIRRKDGTWGGKGRRRNYITIIALAAELYIYTFSTLALVISSIRLILSIN